MKVECSIEKLKTAISQAERVTGKNLSLPILGSILVIVSGKQCKLRATNLSIGIEVDIPAKVEEEGVVAVKGDVIASLFATMGNSGTVVMESVQDNLRVSTKSTNALIKCLPPEDFPTIPIVDAEPVSIPVAKLVEGFRSVYYAAAVSDIKPEIASVYLYADGEFLTFVATDSFRLGEKKVKIKSSAEVPSMLVPFKNVVEVLRIFADDSDTAEVRATKTQLSVTNQSKGVYLTSRLVDGIFPDYRQILPKEETTTVTVLKQDILQALKVSNIFSDKFNQITIAVNPDTKTLEVRSKNSDVGENATVVDVKVSGAAVSASFNHRYFMDCFQSIPQDSLTLSFTQPSRPMVVRGAGDQSFLYLLMPLNR